MKNIKNTGIFLGIILILLPSFIVDVKRKVPVRTVVLQCPTFKAVQNTVNIYANHGYRVAQISPILVNISNTNNSHNHIYDLVCTNNYILIMEK